MDNSRNLDMDLVARSMSFHGQPFQKVWETERGDADINIAENVDFSVYSQRHLNFQDRGKRLKLHQFITSKADTLFDPALNEREERPVVRVSEPGLYAILPPYDTFLNIDKTSRVKHFFQCVKPGDVVIGTIASKPPIGLVIKVLCVEGEAFRYVADLSIKALCPSHSTIQAVDKKNISRSFLINDFVCCEVIDVNEESEKLVCGMKGVHASEHRTRLGLFLAEDFPEIYKQAQEGNNGETYSEMLEKAIGFNNPNNINCLSNTLGLGMNNFSCMSAMREKFPESEFASELRQLQASRWAHRSVADGIEHFKAKRHGEAFQCLNRALNMDPRNIEGLVARGALHANSCSFKKAIEDFETALKLNPNHQNARKYLGETLVAYGRSFEEENKMDEAIKAYESCLAILPYHEEAQNSIDYIKNKKANGTSKLAATADLSIGGLSLNKAQGVKDTLKQLLGESAGNHHLKDTDGHSSAADKASSVANSAKKKKKDKKRRRHRRSSSTSSSSSSASSSSSSSSSSSDSSSASSQDSHHKKKHKRKDKDRERERERSLSPLSKRMAMMDSGLDNEGLSGSALRVHYNPPSMPHSFTSLQAAQQVMEVSEKSDKESEYEQRVRKFLAQTKGDSDYEEKVRKFLDETARWKKEKKAIEEKSKKKKKKEKKAKNKSKKKKREEKRKKKALKELEEKKLREALKRGRRRRSSASLRANDEDDEDEDGYVFGDKNDQAIRMLSMGNIRELEDLQSKLSAYYAKVEKDSPPPPPPLKKKDLSAEKGMGLGKNKISPKIMYEDQDEPKDDDVSPPPPPLPSRLTSSLLVKKRLELLNSESPMAASAPKEVAAPADAPSQRLSDIMPPKFKMQIGNVGNRLKGKKMEDQSSRDMWEDDRERNERELTRFVFADDSAGGGREGDEEDKKSPQLKKKANEDEEEEEEEEEASRSPEVAKPQKRKLRARTSDSESSESRRGGDSSRSRSRSRSRKKYSSESPKKYSSESRSSSYHRKERSRSKSGSYRSRSRRYRSSESGSYRSRSYSRSRSRSRSGDYRRSRSRSDDRHRYRYVGRYPRNRGTYYRPRFQNYKSPRGGGGYGGGGQRGHRNRGYGNRGGNRGYGPPRMRGRGRPRFFHHKYGDRRDYRRYDRGGSRSDEDDLSPMRKVDLAKERIDKMIGAEEKRHSGPLSEGEERDDDFVDRKDYDGKWAKEPEGPRLPPH